METSISRSASIVSALFAAIVLAFALACALPAAQAHAETSGNTVTTQAKAKKITTSGVYTLSGVYQGSTSCSAKAKGGYACTKGTLVAKGVPYAWRDVNGDYRPLSGKSFKFAMKKNCRFYSVGSDGMMRLTAKDAIGRIKRGQAISVQVRVSGKKAVEIDFGAW